MKAITEKEWDKLSYEERRSFTGIIQWPNGYHEYLENGLLHRLDGPAIIYSDGTGIYHYINGKFYDKKDYDKSPEIIKNSKEFKDLLKYKEMEQNDDN